MRFCVLLEEQGVHCQIFELEVWFLHRQPPPLPLHSCLFPVDPDFPSFSGSTSRGSWRGRLVRTRRLHSLSHDAKLRFFQMVDWPREYLSLKSLDLSPCLTQQYRDEMAWLVQDNTCINFMRSWSTSGRI